MEGHLEAIGDRRCLQGLTAFPFRDLLSGNPTISLSAFLASAGAPNQGGWNPPGNGNSATGGDGGAIFTTGSISYASTLCFHDNRSDTATILANIIDGFLADRLPEP